MPNILSTMTLDVVSCCGPFSTRVAQVSPKCTLLIYHSISHPPMGLSQDFSKKVQIISWIGRYCFHCLCTLLSLLLAPVSLTCISIVTSLSIRPFSPPAVADSARYYRLWSFHLPTPRLPRNDSRFNQKPPSSNLHYPNTTLSRR